MIAESSALSGRKRMTLLGAADRARTDGGQTTDTAGLLDDHTLLLFARLLSALCFIIRDERRGVYVQDGQKQSGVLGKCCGSSLLTFVF